MDWTNIGAPSLDEVEWLARAQYATLPASFRNLCGDILFMVQEFPDEDVIRDLDLDSEFDILGLFQGPTLAERTGHTDRPEPTVIFLYRRPILDFWAEQQGVLGAIVRHVIVHEIGHHFGLSDDDMERIEKEA
ncbi:MAG: metallopeptidase family protein [Alphaproteobacteria bacterium]|nr:metallopeptidase family protein [Alphaproteobacteria bacterium]MDE2110938.1 metallopeptidase family protein [Alphaproteobacteria bacterium]MDE2495421.1 metallopeptidase family protein [Alphaproteobacteria bacterium]